MRTPSKPVLASEAFDTETFYVLDRNIMDITDGETGMITDIILWSLSFMVRVPESLKTQCLYLIEEHPYFINRIIKKNYLPLDLHVLLSTTSLCFEKDEESKTKTKTKKRKFKTMFQSFRKRMRF